MTAKRCIAVLSVLLAMCGRGFAQQTIDTASISGRVVDPSGAAIPGAEVTARHVDTNVVAGTTTDQEGRFRFPSLRIGPYEVTIALSGFRTVSRTFALTAGAAYELPVTLPL